MEFHFTTTWLPNGLFVLAALAVVGGLVGINAETTGDRVQAIAVGALLAVVALFLRALGHRMSRNRKSNLALARD